jgi:predicted ATPase/DNA-binding SARP family transcriptional activator
VAARVQLLGAVRAWEASGEIRLGGPKQRAVLAVLALSAGQPVSRDVIVDFVWTGDDPSGATAALHTYIAALRRALGNGSDQRDRAIQSRSGGYLLNVEAVDLDVLRFRRLVDEGRAAAEARADAEAAARFGDAIALRRGPLVDGLGSAARLHPTVVALEQEYLGAALDCADVQLRRGQASDVLGWLPELVRSEPLNEPLQTRLIRAYLAAGYQAQALSAFESVRAALRDELGVDPGEELRGAHLEVLRPEPRTGDATAPRPAGTWLGRRPDPQPLIGRDDDQAQLGALVPDRRVVTLVGPGGVGKTTLALAVAQYVAGQFLDGVVVIECGRIAPDDATVPVPDLVTAAVWQALGANRVGRESQLGAIVRDLSRQQRLLVIDNAEHVADACARLVDHLTRSCPGLRVLVTSRRQLGLASELVWEVRPLALPEPDESDPERIRDSASVQLLLRLARQMRAGARASDGEPSLDAVVRVCRQLGGLPLALELAGARLRGISVADLARSLADRSGEPRSPLLPLQQAVETTFEWSERLLQPVERLLLGRLSVFAATFGPDPASAVCGGPPIEAGAVIDLLGRLVDQSMLQVEHDGDAVRYSMLPPIREFASGRADQRDLDTIRQAHLQWCIDQVRAAGGETPAEHPDHLLDEVNAALAWALSSGQAELVDGAAILLVESRPVLERYPASLDSAWQFTQLALGSNVLRKLTRGRLLHLGGRLAYLLGRIHDVRALLEEAQALLPADDVDDLARLTDIDIGLVSAMESLANPACLTAAEAVVAAAEARGDRRMFALLLSHLANAFSEWGHISEAFAMQRRAEELSDGDWLVGWATAARYATIAGHANDPELVLRWGLPLLARPDISTVPMTHIEVLVDCGWAHARLGDIAAGRALIARGIELCRAARPFHEGYAQLAAADTERLGSRPAAQRRALDGCLRFGLASLDLRPAARAVWLTALLAEQHGRPDAARLAGASLAIRRVTELPAWPLDEDVFDRWRADPRVSDDGGADRHEVIIQAIDLALAFLDGAQLADPGPDEAHRMRVRDH